MKPELIAGGVHADERGVLRFCNDFNLSAVKRFYTIANSAAKPVRGWIGHKCETKWFFPLRGSTIVKVESFACRPQARRLEEFVLEANEPKVLKVPSGNWFIIRQDEPAEVMVFSDCKVGEFKDDDLRRPYEET